MSDHHGVYQSVPFEILTDESKRDTLIRYFKECKGKFRTAREIADEIQYDNRTATEVPLRKAITELIEEGYPIVANKSGFSMATNDSMVEHYINHLEEKKMGLQRRMDSLKKTMNKDTKTQKKQGKEVICGHCMKLKLGVIIQGHGCCYDCKRSIYG